MAVLLGVHRLSCAFATDLNLLLGPYHLKDLMSFNAMWKAGSLHVGTHALRVDWRVLAGCSGFGCIELGE